MKIDWDDFAYRHGGLTIVLVFFGMFSFAIVFVTFLWLVSLSPLFLALFPLAFAILGIYAIHLAKKDAEGE